MGRVMMKEEAPKLLEKEWHTYLHNEGKSVKALDTTLKVLDEQPKKCKWILYDYRTLVPREHEDISNPYWRISASYKTELKYCPYCGREIDYSEVDAEIEKRGNEE